MTILALTILCSIYILFYKIQNEAQSKITFNIVFFYYLSAILIYILVIYIKLYEINILHILQNIRKEVHNIKKSLNID